MTTNKKPIPEKEIIAGIDLSANDMASLIVDALIDGKAVREIDREKCELIVAEELWIRKLLVDGPPVEK